MDNKLAVLNDLEKAKIIISNTKNIDELKKIKDKTEALKMYAKQQGYAIEIQNDINEVNMRSKRRIGELSMEMPKDDKWSNSQDGKLIKLKEAGIQHYERYEAIASIPADKFEAILAEAKERSQKVTNNMLVNIAREADKKKRDLELKNKNFNMPDGEYQVIYADPPWEYGDKQNTDKLGGAKKHYPVMSIEELRKITMPKTAENAVLFLWVTSPLLEESFEVINAWGFKYKTSFIWDKVKHNMGHYNSVRHELLLLATKGSCTPDNIKLFDSVQSIEKKEHSQKPIEFYEIIETLYNGNKIEMFARNKREGWASWGNELC